MTLSITPLFVLALCFRISHAVSGWARKKTKIPLSARYGISSNSPHRRLDLPTYEEEDDISFDGTNLDEIIGLALQKAQAQDDDDDDNADDDDDDNANPNFCENESEGLSLQPLLWEYTVEFLAFANVTAIIEKLEVVLEAQMAELVLECNSNSNSNSNNAGGTNILGETASPDDSPAEDDEFCIAQDPTKNECQHFNGRMSLFLSGDNTEDNTEGLAVAFARSQIGEIFADPSFVIQVGLGLISVQFRQAQTLADVEDPDSNSITERSGEDTGETSYFIISTMAGGFVFFAVVLFVWRRRCYKNEGRHDLDGGTTLAPSQMNAPATITINTAADVYSSEEEIESPFSESPYSSRLQYYGEKHDWGQPLSYISEVTESRSSGSESGRISNVYSQDSPCMSTQTPISIDRVPSETESPNVLRDFIGIYNNPSNEGGRTTFADDGSSVLGINKRYRRNDFARGQLADAASVLSNGESSQLSAIADDSTSSVGSSAASGSTNNNIDGENLLDRTRDSEQEDDLLFEEEV